MSFTYKKFLHNGQTRTVKEWCAIKKVNIRTVRSRYDRGASSFNELFKVSPTTERNAAVEVATKAEEVLANLNMIEFLFEEDVANKFMHYVAEFHKTGWVRSETDPSKYAYSVRGTLNELLRRGMFQYEALMAKADIDKTAGEAVQAAHLKQLYPNGMPDQIIPKAKSYNIKSSDLALGINPAPQITLPPPMTLEEAADIGDW